MKKYKYKQQAHLGYDANGKQIRKWFYADTKTDLTRQIDKCKSEMSKVTNPSDISFGEYSRQVLDIHRPTVGTRTMEALEYHAGKCEELNSIPIKKITKSMCQRLINDNWDHPHTAKGVADVLRMILQSALEDGIIAMNPAATVKRPPLPKPKFHLLTDQELEAVDKADLDENDRLFVTIMRVFGLRPAEALALTPKDFDLDKKILHITKALEIPKSGPSRIKGTKTNVSREIPIPDYLIPALRKQFRENPGFHLFLNGTGSLHTKTSYKRLSARIWKAVNIALGGDDNHNLAKGLRIYDFRHRRATDLYYLCQRGIISTKKAAELMGHSEVMFLQRYSHLDESQEQTADIYSNQKPVNL